MFQVRITFFLVVLVNDAVRNDLEETRTVDRAGIRETQVGVLMHIVFGMEAGQHIRIFLVAFRINIAGKLQDITLIGMFHTDTSDKFPLVPGIFCHTVSGADSFGRIIVQRVSDITIFTRSKLYLVEVIPILVDVLWIFRAGCRIECVFIEEAVTLFITIHTSGREIEC